MAKETQKQQGYQIQSYEEGAEILKQMLERSPSQMPLVVRKAFSDPAIEKRVADVLPENMKGQARTLISRAQVTLGKTPDLHTCNPLEFIRCVVEAAELGFAIDGRMCYAILYKGKGAPTLQLQLDYKGMIAVARRAGTIEDCYGRVVCLNDKFKYGQDGGKDLLKWEPGPDDDRGEIRGAFAVVRLPTGAWRSEWMTTAQIEKVRASSKTDKIWGTHYGEMCKKSVIRRALKLYCDDPLIQQMIQAEEEWEGRSEATTVLNGKMADPGLRSELPDPGGKKQDPF
jgi:recombination protein RecT